MNENRKEISHRLIYSGWDFQQALSALTFLLEECEYDKRYSKVEMRRFRCFETTLIVSFARPFKAGWGRENLDLSKIGFTFTEEDLILKNKIIKLRDKVISHSDEEQMHYKSYSFKPIDDRDIRVPMTVFNESLYLNESEVRAIENLLHRVLDKLAKYEFELVQGEHEAFNKSKTPTNT
ncbi:hypothetical protein [Thalassotalea sediminis]|uniref:hypothetical protein n=1 Tax=Thalassotalea sediminis TaxID=1759089 RepID=UPI0025738A13|nr:hypothetical protein [Thalassotalea sediminis]